MVPSPFEVRRHREGLPVGAWKGLAVALAIVGAVALCCWKGLR
jgi:hypothetical protein